MRILIVGGGIGGLALSTFLRRQKHDVVLIERCHEWKTIGYGVGMFPSGLRVLRDLGVADALEAVSASLPAHLVKDQNGNLLRASSFDRMRRKHGPVLEVERDTLHKYLRETSSGTDVRMGTVVTTLKQDATGVDVTFGSGATDRFDIVVGADGINSQIRTFVQAKSHKAYTGLTFWLMWIKGMSTPPKEVVYYLGDAKIVGVFPCKNDHMLALFGLPAKAHAYNDPTHFRDVIRDHFKGMTQSIDEMLEHLPENAEMYHNDDEEMHLKQWHSGRVVLLGDAIHALSPILGMGASMALEDARVLSEEIDVCGGNVQSAFVRYHRRRLPRVRHLARWSWVLHRMTNMGGRLGRVRNVFMKHGFIRAYFWNLERFMGQKV